MPKTRRRRTPHPFVLDHELEDVPGGVQTCARCHLPDGNDIHRMPTADEQLKALESRRLGDQH